MGTRESSAPSTQVVAFEMQKKEELILDEYTESLTIYEGGSVGMDFVGKRVAEGKKTTCISGNNCDGASQSAASRGEDSSDKSGGTSRNIKCANEVGMLLSSSFAQLDLNYHFRNLPMFRFLSVLLAIHLWCLVYAKATIVLSLAVLPSIHFYCFDRKIMNREWKEEDWLTGKLLGGQEYADSKNVRNYKPPQRFLRARLPRSHAIYGGFLSKLRNSRKKTTAYLMS